MPRWTVALLLFILTTAFADAQTGLVKAEKNLPLRAEPKISAKAIDQLPRFQPVKILDRKDKFAKIRTIKTDPKQAKEGWVTASYVSETAFLTVDGDKVNARQGPGTEFPVILQYGNPNPLFVLDVARNGWVKVLDSDGDRSWIAPSCLTFGPRCVVVKNPQSNIRSGGGKDYEKFPVAFIAERGVYLQVVEEKDGWLHVKHDGGQEGWISAKLVFGWVDEELPKPAKKAEEPAVKTKKAPKTEKSAPKKSSAKKSTTAKSKAGKTAKKAS